MPGLLQDRTFLLCILFEILRGSSNLASALESASFTPLCSRVLGCLLSQLLPKPPIWLLNSLLFSHCLMSSVVSLSWHGEPLTSRVMSQLILQSWCPVIFQVEVSRFCPVFLVMWWRARRGGGWEEGINMCVEGTAFGTNVAVLSLRFVWKLVLWIVAYSNWTLCARCEGLREKLPSPW